MKKGKKQITNEELSKYSIMLEPDLREAITRLGYKLTEVRFVNENQTNYLRITISHGDHLISLDDCELVSKEMGGELDKKDLIRFPYVLEVQSQGIDKGEICEAENGLVKAKL